MHGDERCFCCAGEAAAEYFNLLEHLCADEVKAAHAVARGLPHGIASHLATVLLPLLTAEFGGNAVLDTALLALLGQAPGANRCSMISGRRHMFQLSP